MCAILSCMMSDDIFNIFSGGKSSGKVAGNFGFEVIQIDVNADINCDSLDWGGLLYMILGLLMSFGLHRLAPNTAEQKQQDLES